MEREISEPFLRKTERRVALGEMDVAQRVRQIFELERRGEDSRQARGWLVQLEEQLSRDIAQRNRLKRNIEEHQKGDGGPSEGRAGISTSQTCPPPYILPGRKLAYRSSPASMPVFYTKLHKNDDPKNVSL